MVLNEPGPEAGDEPAVFLHQEQRLHLQRMLDGPKRIKGVVACGEPFLNATGEELVQELKRLVRTCR